MWLSVVRDLLFDAGNTHRWCSFTHEIGPLAPAIWGSDADRECGSEREKRRCLTHERFSRRILRLYIAPGTKPGLLCMCQVVRHPPKRNPVAALGNALAGRATCVLPRRSHVTDEQQTSTEAPDVHRCAAGRVADWPSRDEDTAGPFLHRRPGAFAPHGRTHAVVSVLMLLVAHLRQGGLAGRDPKKAGVAARSSGPERASVRTNTASIAGESCRINR